MFRSPWGAAKDRADWFVGAQGLKKPGMDCCVRRNGKNSSGCGSPGYGAVVRIPFPTLR